MSSPRKAALTRRGGRARDAGLTLVELMITLIIGSLVASSTFVFFAGQKSIYETQTKILNVQQNLWQAMEALIRKYRTAGSGLFGCVRPDSDGQVGADTGDPPPSGNTPPATGLRAFIANPAPPGYTGNAMNRLAPLWIRNGAAGAPDSLTVVYGLRTSGNFTDAQLNSTVAGATDPIDVAAGETAAFRAPLGNTPGEFIALVHNTFSPPSLNMDRGCTLFQITGISGGNTRLDHGISSLFNTNAPTPAMFTWGNPAGMGVYNAANSGIRNLGQLRWIRFEIDATGPVPNLTMRRLDQRLVDGTVAPEQVLSEGIEDLQLAFACDLGNGAGGPPDGILNENLAVPANDEWTGNSAADVAPPACNQPHALRITLVARSTLDNTLTELNTTGANRKPAAEDSPEGAPDSFRHRMMQTTVYARNQ